MTSMVDNDVLWDCVTEVLISAGVCQMYRPSNDDHQAGAKGWPAKVWSWAQSSADWSIKGCHRVRVRWPREVLEQLLHVALNGVQGSLMDGDGSQHSMHLTEREYHDQNTPAPSWLVPAKCVLGYASQAILGSAMQVLFISLS
jgi:hypothetical protein